MIETMTKTANKKKQKYIKLLNSANEAAACLVELANKAHDENFSNLEQMQAYMKKQVTSQKKEPGNERSEEGEENGNYAVSKTVQF
jgi:hypothetical protein